jgi:hypothetical protein
MLEVRTIPRHQASATRKPQAMNLFFLDAFICIAVVFSFCVFCTGKLSRYETRNLVDHHMPGLAAVFAVIQTLSRVILNRVDRLASDHFSGVP